MKADELMIGDWVRCLDTPQPCRIEEIVNITEEVFFADDDSCDGGFYVKIAELQPIPLTEDILKKNGFKVDHYKTWTQTHVFYTWAENGRRAVVDFVKGELHSIMVYGILHSFESNRISSVHEFQHALRLCGVECEIKL